jgi:hypothetical protein
MKYLLVYNKVIDENPLGIVMGQFTKHFSSIEAAITFINCTNCQLVQLTLV